MTSRRPLLPLRLERWRVPPGWRWFRLPGYARRWDRALDAERLGRDPVLRDWVDYRIALDRAVERINAFSRLVRRAAERGRLP